MPELVWQLCIYKFLCSYLIDNIEPKPVGLQFGRMTWDVVL